MRVGVFGGTFDPPHSGHLAFAKAAQEHLQLDEILFVPTSRNPLKMKPPVANARHRLGMIQALVETEPSFAACDLEIQKGGLSYTVETMTELQVALPAEYWLLIGLDALKSIEEWKQPHRLIRLCRLAVAMRPPLTEVDVLAKVKDEFKERIDVVPMKPIDLSSTTIRAALAANRTTQQDLPKSVSEYIKKNNLYKSA